MYTDIGQSGGNLKFNKVMQTSQNSVQERKRKNFPLSFVD